MPEPKVSNSPKPSSGAEFRKIRFINMEEKFELYDQIHLK